MIVTTAGRANPQLIAKAKDLALKYGLIYRHRNSESVDAIKESEQKDVLVVGKDKIFISPINSDEKLIFHPNLAMIRVKRILKGEEDPFISATGLKSGMRFLDCTLGLASDSIVASLIVGKHGRVFGIEGNKLLYLLVTEGLASFSSGNQEVDQAMKRIKTIHGDHYSFLKQAETSSFDVVYFDPMFQSTIKESDGINALRDQAIYSELTSEIISEAKRVARKRIVLKDHWKSERFSQLGFTQIKRKSSLFHYGILEIG